MADKYTYPGVFDPDERGPEYGYTVTFPDLPGCISEGDSLEEALNTAQEALPDGAFVTLAQAVMPLIRERMANKSVNIGVLPPRRR